MKRLIILAIVMVAVLATVATSTTAAECKSCARIQDGTIVDVKGNPVTTGYDQFGYNYQGHLFNGRYCDYDRVAGGAWCDVELMMKWNDAWLSNKDCDGSHLLDRSGDGDDDQTYIGSGAWLTNHQWGTYDDGTEWDYFIKIVAAPADATNVAGIWYAADGAEIGPAIWGAFAIIQEVENDPILGRDGLQYLSEAPAGFGFYTP